jgi:hypothetical protein
VPISDNYFVQSLLQSTRTGNPVLEWTAKESEGFRSELNGVQLDLDSVPTRAGPRLYLSLTRDRQRAFVEEPFNTGFFVEDYQSESQREVARLLRELYCAVAEQISERESMSGTSPVREALFRIALFGPTDEVTRPAFQSGTG